MSVNIVIDAVMISRGVGANGLAGVNVAIPKHFRFSSLFHYGSEWAGQRYTPLH